MNNNERTQAKIGTIFQIADLYLSNKLLLKEARVQIYNEMHNIRPVQFETFKLELSERIKDEDNYEETKKLLGLFANYLPFPYKRLEEGHPLRNYYEENDIVKSYLIKLDEMEGKTAIFNDWKDIYQSFNKYKIHIKRLKKNLYPIMISMGMDMQVEKAEKLGDVITNDISKNQEMLNNGDILNFLLNQRKLTLNFMEYLDLEEKVLIFKAFKVMNKQDLVELRRLDDIEGYVYIDKPKEFVPQKDDRALPKGNHIDDTILLPALLQAKEISLIYYNLSGEAIYTVGDQIGKSDLYLAEETIGLLKRENKGQRKLVTKQEDYTYVITYSLVKDKQGIIQGILKTKEDISYLKDFTEEQWPNSRAGIPGNIKKIDIKIDTNKGISELFDMYPKFKDDFFNLDKELMGLKGPMGMELLKKSTIGMLAKSLRIEADIFINQINELIRIYSD